MRRRWALTQAERGSDGLRSRLVRVGQKRCLRTVVRLATLVAALACTTCTSVVRWAGNFGQGNFDIAERLAHESDRPMLIAYWDGRAEIDRPLSDALRSPEVQLKAKGYVRCDVFRTNEPDRRYAAQFGVERPGALIVVHPDQTYQAQPGFISASDVARFLDEAKPPGATRVLNPHIPRQVAYDWHRTLPAAREEAERTGRPILLVVDRVLVGDRRKLNKVLNRPEVYRRFADMVHCRVRSFNPFADSYETPLGAVHLPAIIFIHRDGTHHVLEKPLSVEAIVRFADHWVAPSPVAVGDP